MTSVRRVHQLFSLIVFPLLLNACTGTAYGLLLYMGVDSAKLEILMKLHTGSLLHPIVGTWWPITLAVVTIVFLSCGTLLWLKGDRLAHKPRTSRQWHRFLAVYCAPPLFFSCLTGGAYRFCRRVVGMPKPQVAWLLMMHSGKWFHLPQGVLPLLVLLSLGAMCYTGTPMAWWRRNFRPLAMYEA
eukprot:NODE_5459_length_651_cov_30.290076_g5295_i0.p1 GENE.NODE_5459_length_651_cov_30.290076_g5295_i0~~NODE_5459_length_651_cov_30.290076_g5295_i0.p1  ORF type:complete len:201 (+),score=42.12 NODE_5459_length_651_cov_30.290076_g5295_i0:49-603(+)